MALYESQVAPLLLVNPGPPPLEPDEVQVGIFVFSRDGQELGQVEEVTDERFLLRNEDDGPAFWLRLEDARPATAGRMALDFDSADLPEHAERA
jgi:hypothetical protein